MVQWRRVTAAAWYRIPVPVLHQRYVERARGRCSGGFFGAHTEVIAQHSVFRHAARVHNCHEWESNPLSSGHAKWSRIWQRQAAAQ